MAGLIALSCGASVDSATAYSDSRVSVHAVSGQGPSCPLVGYTRERCLLWQVVAVLAARGFLMSDTTDIKFSEEHAGKILPVALLLPSVITYALNLMAAPVRLLAIPTVLAFVCLFVSLGGYSARKRRKG